MTGSRQRKPFGRAAWLLAIAVAVPAVSLSRVPGLHKLELLVYDWHCAALPRLPPDPRLVLIGMDDGSLDYLQRPSYPLPRSMHGRMVDILREAGAKVIAFDVMFTYAAPELKADDAAFAAAMARYGKVVAGLTPITQFKDGRESVTFQEPDPRLRPYIRAASILMPRAFGNKVRWFPPYPADNVTTDRYLHLSVALVASYYGVADEQPYIRNRFVLGPISIPRLEANDTLFGDEDETLVRYVGPPKTFPYIPYHEVYDGSWKHRLGSDFFRGKIVLIGRISDLEDRQETPVGYMQGAEILLNAAQTVLQKLWLRPWSVSQNRLAAVSLCLVFTLSVWWGGLPRGFLVFLVECAGWAVLSHQLFVRAGVWADTLEPLSALTLVLACTALVETRRVRGALARFMPSWVAHQMLEDRENALAASADREVTAVFCDIRDFTRISEMVAPKTLESMLLEYFSAGEEAAHRFGTQLDKFVGDEIVLYFDEYDRGRAERLGLGPARAREPHAVRAVRWALAMQEAALRIDRSGVAGEVGFRIGIGICSGPARISMVGGRQRRQHTVIGDAVNTASRLQAATKEVGRGIVIAESTSARVAGWVETEPLGEIRVKGKQEPIRISTPIRAIREGTGAGRSRAVAEESERDDTGGRA